MYSEQRKVERLNNTSNAREALSLLMKQWENYLKQKKAAGLLKLDDELTNAISRNISQLYEDWNFIRYYRVDRYTGHSDPIIQNVYNLNDRITRDRNCGSKYLKKKLPHELLSLLLEYRKETDDILNSQTGEALGRFIEGRFKHNFADSLVSFHCHGNGVRNGYLEGIKSDHVNVDALINKLERIQQYFFKGISNLFKWDGEPYALLTFMAAVYEKIASHSFEVWINRHNVKMVTVKAAKLVDLERQIDPVNPEFMNLLLSFLVDIRDKQSQQLRVEIFCDYLLTDSLKCLTKYGAFREELRSLVGIYVMTRLQYYSSLVQGYSSLEEFSCLFEQTESVLRDTSILHLSVAEKNTSTICDQLECKVHFLRIELFIREQLSSRDTSLMRMSKLRVFVEGLRISRASYHDKQYVILTEEINDMLEPVLLKSSIETGIGVDNLLQQVLFKIIFFKAEASLFRILKRIQSHDMDLKPIKQDQISSLVEELADFKRLIATELIWTLPELRCTIAELGKMIELLPEDFEEISLSLVQLSHKVKCVKAMLQPISAPSALSNVPKTCSPGFIKFLGRNIKELLKYDPPSIAPMKYQLKKVQRQLESLGSLIMQVSDFEVENGDLNDQISQTTHKLEYVVESIEFDSDSKYLFWLYNLVEDITAINQQVTKISNVVTSKTLPRISREVLTTTISGFNEVVVDLVDKEKAIINQLTRGSRMRDIVSIVGMPGIGKTTLASRVYNSKSIMCHFHRLAWCTVSQVYSERELLLDILSGIHGVTDEIQKMTDNELQVKVRQCLLGRRYLIILDDVWDLRVWNYLQICFPDDSNGSRILITSRHQDLQSVIKPGSEPNVMPLFVDEVSWTLLEKKIFGEGVSCPRELVLLGKKIAQQCEGLPLAIVAIAGLLQKTKMTRDCWAKISESLPTRVINDPENRCREVLELSYKHLSSDLKACFLYLGAFLVDKDIPMKKLIQFWIAEGFIHEIESKSLEKVASDYLMELINRSLVIITTKGSYRKVKACRVHDLLRDLFRSKAKFDNFLNLVTINDEPYASFPAYEYDMEFQNKHKLNPVTFESYRLSIYLRRNHFFDSRPSGPRVRSLIFFAYEDKESRRPYDISFICENFRLLRVLDLECINIGVNFPDEIGLMIQLRYLAISGYLLSIPPSISNLWKLQFFLVRGLRGTVFLPVTIWSMKKLRYLHVNEHVSFNLKGHGEEVECLDTLVSFSTPSLFLGDNTISILRRFPNLLKMRCIFLESSYASKCDSQFPTLGFLTQLESLKIIYYGGAINSGEFALPLSLKKLTLSGFQLPWRHVSRVGMLPNLKVLKLLSGAFEGPRWEMNEDEFKALEFLKLEDLNIATWDADSDHLPNLIQLVLRNCKDLEEIPQNFASINTLELIQVQWCKKSVEESAKSIGDAIEAIKVDISL